MLKKSIDSVSPHAVQEAVPQILTDFPEVYAVRRPASRAFPADVLASNANLADSVAQGGGLDLGPSVYAITTPLGIKNKFLSFTGPAVPACAHNDAHEMITANTSLMIAFLESRPRPAWMQSFVGAAAALANGPLHASVVQQKENCEGVQGDATALLV